MKSGTGVTEPALMLFFNAKKKHLPSYVVLSNWQNVAHFHFRKYRAAQPPVSIIPVMHRLILHSQKFVKGYFIGFSCMFLFCCPTAQEPTWFLHVPVGGSQQACLSVCALATRLFLQVQKSLLHCSAAQPYNQALFLFWGSGARGTPRASTATYSLSAAGRTHIHGKLSCPSRVFLSTLSLSSSFSARLPPS